MNRRHAKSRGQALVMVTLALIAMCGLMGLAVDLGWSFYLQKQAQAAADAGAMGAIQQALYQMKLNGSYVAPCSQSGIKCSSSVVTCPAADNLESACEYAARNGFSSGVAITANDNTTMPVYTGGTLSSTTMEYWVTVSVAQTVPQLFSAVLGNKTGTISAKSTAAVLGSVVPGNIVLLNQPGDCYTTGGIFVGGSQVCGININMTGFLGSNSISAQGPILMSSTCHGQVSGALACTGDAGQSGGLFAGANVSSNSGIYVQKPGVAGPGVSWSPTPTQSTSNIFGDPTEGLAQPPLASTSVPPCGILNGQLGSTTGTVVAGPYAYYAYTLNHGVQTPSGAPISLVGNVSFEATGTCQGTSGGSNTQSSSAFPAYYFIGGLQMNADQGNAGTIDFYPGQYIMVGQNATSGNCQGASLCFGGWGETIQSVTATGGTFVFPPFSQSASPPDVPASYTGNMFILTSPNSTYPGLSTELDSYTVLGQASSGLSAGSLSFSSLGTAFTQGQVTLIGVNLNAPSLPSQYQQYGGILFWQDRFDSTVEYNANGYVINATNPTQPPAGANGINLFGFLSGPVNMNGVIYQPRGAYVSDSQFISAASLNTWVQLITGSIDVSSVLAATTMNVGIPTLPLTKFVTALIQ